jgi:hypothetical protein
MRRFGIVLVLATLGGCAPTTVRMDATRLQATPPPGQRLACPYRLGALTDARPANGSAGSVGGKAFELPDAMAVVRHQLEAAGLETDGQGRPVDIRLMQLYLSQNTITLVPVVVYEATVAGRPPVVIRGQPTSMNDWGSANEAMGAYAAALRSANTKLVTALNMACAGG